MFNLSFLSNLNKGDKVFVDTNTGVSYSNVFFESQNEIHIIIHDYLHDKFIEIEKSSIVEIFNETKNAAIPLIKLQRNVPREKQRLFTFLDSEHEENYDLLLEKWPLAKNDKEYASALYILAIPMIFKKIQNRYHAFETPIDWIFDYECKFSEDAYTLFGVTEEEQERYVIDYDLTDSMKHLGRLAMHLWNGYKGFHLLQCINTLEPKYIVAMNQAIIIRFEN
ncbi:DUF2538 family protein [Solibacillus sp. FSL W7-1436]|uniref:DUF2538 family protein n=1 Tax=Solibacillus sp. FSL W7-1436 TaxID=2921705 RepID=UPI0030F85D52